MADDAYQIGWRLGDGLFPSQRPKPLLQSWWGATTSAPGQDNTLSPVSDTASRNSPVPLQVRVPDPRAKPSSGTNDWRQLDPPQGMEAGESGSGYYVYGTDKTGAAGTTSNAQWGTSKTMQVIHAVADKLGTGDQYTPFGVWNISLQGGADFSGPYGHKGHKDGINVDVRPVRTDGAQEPVTYRDAAYDRVATQRLVDAFHSTGQVGNIYFNDPQIHGVLPQDEHDGHLHIKIKP